MTHLHKNIYTRTDEDEEEVASPAGMLHEIKCNDGTVHGGVWGQSLDANLNMRGPSLQSAPE